jgi:hypothetical protein
VCGKEWTYATQCRERSANALLWLVQVRAKRTKKQKSVMLMRWQFEKVEGLADSQKIYKTLMFNLMLSTETFTYVEWPEPWINFQNNQENSCEGSL